MPDELKDAKELPKEMSYLWSWYWQMYTPPGKLLYSEILAWSQLTRHSLEPWEVATLKKIDEMRYAIANEV